MNTIYFHQKSGFEDRLENLILKNFQEEQSVEVHVFSKEQIEKYLPSKFVIGSLDVLIIPTVFDSSNYMSYDGIEFALIWYFHLIKTDKPFAIILVGTESQSSFFRHCDYSNFLKCPNVHYVDFNFTKITALLQSLELKKFLEKDYIDTLRNVNLKPPTSYKTHHSIANEWAIYRWANTIGATDKDIKQIESKVENQLYFQYLQTIFPISNIPIIDQNELKIEKLQDSRIFYIDDEADKGWYEIFCKILVDINEVKEFDYLGDELKGKSEAEIISLSIDKVKEQDSDIVILDFRLHENDFSDDISKVTGLQILKRIKEINPGIQVIIFSATNKIWNLKALQNTKADGFIFKESAENSVDPNFTIDAIDSFISEIDKANNRRFLKEAYLLIKQLKIKLDGISNDNKIGGLEKLNTLKLKNEIYIQLDLSYECLKQSDSSVSTIEEDHSFLNLSYISLYKIIELINDYFTESNFKERKVTLKFKGGKVKKYNQSSDKFEDISDGIFSTKNKLLSIYKFELNSNAVEIVSDLGGCVNNRNDIIHPKTLKDYKKTTKIENIAFLKLLNEIISKMS